MNEDLLIYGLMAVFATGAMAWLLFAFMLLVGCYRALAAVVRLLLPQGRHGSAAPERRCPCGGTMETCRCGDNPGNPRRMQLVGAL